ncbi:MAG: exopolyphosphatase [Nitrospinae bacterium]|nr:exopolyphosphatase [Nitrospinota bacterium]
MRIITRGDFDGLVCSVLLTEAEDISEIRFTHPKVIQARELAVTSDDILVNLPYDPDCGMWFDHHLSESDTGFRPESFKGRYGLAPSCARLILEHYNLPHWGKYADLVNDTDKVDAAQLSLNDILRPEGWVRLANTVDPRTGFPPSQQYFMDLIGLIKEHPIAEILAMDEVKNRLREFFRHQEIFTGLLQKNSSLRGPVVLTDMRNVEQETIGSRFLIYALFPTANVSVRAFHVSKRAFVVIAVGRSILNRTCEKDVGMLMKSYGGGGHPGAGTCRVPSKDADDVINEIVEKLS